jgi:hypothetical protein
MSVSGNLLDSRNFNNVKSGVVEVDYRADQAFDGPKSFFTVPDGKVFVLTDILISTNTRPAPCDPVTLRIYGSDALRTTIINCGEQQHIELQSGIPFQAAEDIRITSSHPNVIMGITIVGVERDPTQPSCLLSVGR